MSEEKKHMQTDLMMRSVIRNGQEDVPAHIWDGIASGLDKAARHRRVLLMWRGAAAASLAAAAVAALLFLNHGGKETPQQMVAEDLSAESIDVIRPETTGNESGKDLVAYVAPEVRKATAKEVVVTEAVKAEERTEDYSQVQSGERTGEDSADGKAQKGKNSAGKQEGRTSERDRWAQETDRWIPEQEKRHSGAKVSLVLSGITGTNSPQSTASRNILKRPTLSKQKYGIVEKDPNSTYGVPVSAGIGVKVSLTPRWAVSAGVNYTFLTRKFLGTYIPEDPTATNITSSIRNSQHYIGIPVNVFYNIVGKERLNFYAYAGGTVERCVSNKYDILVTSTIYREQAEGVQLSANIGIGLEFLLGKHVGIYLDPSLRYYFDNNQPKSIRTAQPLMLGFEFGIRARL